MNLTTSTVPKEVEKKILVAIDLKKQLEQYEKEIKEELLEAMKANDIVSIKNDAYTVTRATRATYKGENNQFMKSVLDTTRVGAYVKLNGELPKGVEKSESQYITWRAK